MKTPAFLLGLGFFDVEKFLFNQILEKLLQLLGDRDGFLWCYET